MASRGVDPARRPCGCPAGFPVLLPSKSPYNKYICIYKSKEDLMAADLVILTCIGLASFGIGFLHGRISDIRFLRESRGY